MSKFIVLNTKNPKDIPSGPVLLFIDKITSVESDETGKGSIIRTINYFNPTYFVMESMEQILNMIENQS